MVKLVVGIENSLWKWFFWDYFKETRTRNMWKIFPLILSKNIQTETTCCLSLYIFEGSELTFQFLNDESANWIFFDIIVNFIIQKMKSKHTSLKKYTNWDNWVWNERKYFSHISGLEFLKTHHCALCFKSLVILLLLLLACAIYGIYLWSLLHSAAQKTMPVAFFGGVCHILRNCNKIA